ncbi:iron-sulfur cluster biosynthesis family protein [Siminovitchia sp. 179-K 8D1 HS]|uniref:iron-sulfur cluster biosynthesis family protein n=1 Tax=Siminovitchia sp. 179-K 8D1 HS TaxID=3142385 RepID=UPI00399F253B
MVTVSITEKAAEKIKEKLGDRDLALKLIYETDGCAVSGIPTLKFEKTQKAANDELVIETNKMPLLIEKSKLVYLDSELEIDFSDDSHTFQLTSPNEILNGRMSLLD